MKTPDLTDKPWRKSSRSSGNGQCVEVCGQGGTICVRDSKNPAGSVLAFNPVAWTVFTASLKDGKIRA